MVVAYLFKPSRYKPGARQDPGDLYPVNFDAAKITVIPGPYLLEAEFTQQFFSLAYS